MRSHPESGRVLADRIPLPAGILEPERCASLPKGSLGYEYHRHCRENRLDPKLVSVESEKVDREFPATAEHALVYDRDRDSHDLWHVLTGYGTDMAGEAGIIPWTFAQTGNPGYLLIFLLNALSCLKRGRPDVFCTCWQGYRHGKRSPLLLAVDWTSYLDRPIEEVRRSLGLEVARPYPMFHMADAPGAPDELPS